MHTWLITGCSKGFGRSQAQAAVDAVHLAKAYNTQSLEEVETYSADSARTDTK